MATAKSLELAIRIAGKVEKSLGAAFGTANRHVTKLEKAATTMSTAVAAGTTAIGGAAIAAGKQLLDLGGTWQEAANQLASATGTAGAELDGLRDTMEAIYANNFGENVEDVAESLAKVKTNMGSLPTDQLQGATEAALALRDALDYDVEETTRAAETLRKNFGGSAKEAFGLIAAGAQNGLDYSGELLDTINEYSSQFAKLGFSADGMFQLFQAGADSTAWNLDKIGDAVKEFSIRAIDGSDGTTKALKALGYNANDTMKVFAAGGQAANDAFFDVLNRLMDVKDQVQRDALGVSLFGTMWEDLGVEAMTALSNASNAAYDTGNALAQINNIKYNDLGSAMEGLRRKIEVSLLPAANAMYQAFLQQSPQVEAALDELSPTLERLARDFTVDSVVFLADNLPHLIQLAKEAGVTAAELYRTARPLLSFLWDNKEAVLALTAGLRVLGPTITGVATAMTAFGTIKTYTALFSTWAKATALLTAAKMKDKTETLIIYGLYAKDAAAKGASTAATIAHTAATKAATIAQTASSKAVNVATTIAHTAATKAATVATVAHTVATKAATVASYGLGTAVKFMTGPFGIALMAITAVIGAGVLLYKNWDTVEAKAGELWTIFSQAFPGMAAILSAWGNNILLAVDNVKAIFTNVIDFINNVFAGNWEAAWQNIVNIFGNLFGMIINLAKAPINGVIAAINLVLSKINSISVTIPDWVPGVGGKKLGFSLPTIPQLAEGGVVTSPTLAEIGEGGEPEAVLPLSKLAQILKAISGFTLPQEAEQTAEKAETPNIPDWMPKLPKMPKMPEVTIDIPIPKLPTLKVEGGPEWPAPTGMEVEGAPEEATILRGLAQLLKQLRGTDLPKNQEGSKETDGDPQVIQFAPVFHFYGSVTKEEAEEAGRLSFAQFKRLYRQMVQENRRKQFSPT